MDMDAYRGRFRQECKKWNHCFNMLCIRHFAVCHKKSSPECYFYHFGHHDCIECCCSYAFQRNAIRRIRVHCHRHLDWFLCRLCCPLFSCLYALKWLNQKRKDEAILQRDGCQYSQWMSYYFWLRCILIRRYLYFLHQICFHHLPHCDCFYHRCRIHIWCHVSRLWT